MNKLDYIVDEDSDYSIDDITFFNDGMSYEDKLKEADQKAKNLDMTFVILENESYPTGLVGYLVKDNTFRLVYADDLMIADLMDNNDWNEEDAIDWFGYNTMRGIPYCYTEDAPCPLVIFRSYD